MFEGAARGVALAVGEKGEAEFHAMGRKVGRKFDGALQVADSLGGGGGREATVDQTNEQALGGAETRDFVVPAAEDMVGVVVIRIQRDGAFGLVADGAGGFDSRARVGVEAEFTVGDGEREDVDGVVGLEFDGAAGVGESFGAEAAFFTEVACVDGEVGILARNFLEDGGIVRVCGVGAEEEIERGFRVEAAFGCKGVA